MDYKKVIDKLVRELSYRVGIPDVENKEHQSIMSEILSEWGEYDVKEKLFEFLTEKDEKKPEDDNYYNTGGKGYIKMTDKAKYDSQGKDFDGETFTKEGPGVYKAMEKGGDGDKTKTNTNAVKKTIGKDSDYGKKEAERQARVADKEKNAGGPTDGSKDVEIVSDLNRDVFDTKKNKTKVAYKDNPDGPTRNQMLDGLNSGSLDVLSEFQDGVSANREKGIAGAGGAAASEGESKYCGAVDTNFDKWESDNQEAISKKEAEIKSRKRSADESRTATQLGMNVDSPEFNTYLTKREVWGQQELEKIKKDKNSVFYKKGKAGFGGKDEAYVDWMNAAYDGAISTQKHVKELDILDSSKPSKTIQSTQETNDAVQAHLEDNVKNPKSDEDRDYAKKQLKNFRKYKGYHDTFIIGYDKKGRTTYLGISNKKDDQLRDPQNNSNPSKRFKVLKEKFGADVAQGVTNSLEKNIKRVDEVKQTTVKASSNLEITDEYAKLCETKELQPYVQKLREVGKFRDYLKAKNLDPDTIGTKELLIEMNNQTREIIEAGGKPSYGVYGKIAIKVGEFSIKDNFKKNHPKINFDDSAIVGAGQIKETEKQTVKESHLSFVSDLEEVDKPDGYSNDNPDADNGPHQQGYVGGVLDALHIDSYIDSDDDDGMLIQMGINSVTPSMIKKCVAERSGFTGDSTTSEGKKALKDHLRKRCRITPGESSVKIMNDGKEEELFDDTWRTAGESQKIATGFGEGMRDCLIKRAAN